MADAVLRVGLVGVGGIAGQHFKLLSAEPGVRVVGITDVDAPRLQQRSGEWSVTAYPSLDALLAQVDAVFICTPPAHHREPTIQAAAAGVHVFCEKPIALTLADADAMAEACRRAGVLLQIGTNFHFHPSYRAMWQLWQAGTLGELASCWMRSVHTFPSHGWEQRRLQGHWRMRPEDSGGRLFEQIHIVNWLHWIGGPVRSVFGHALAVAPDLPVDDLDLAVLQFARGFGVAELAMVPAAVAEAATGIIGTRGAVALRGERLLLRRSGATADEEVPAAAVVSRQRHFLECVRQGREPENNGADGRMSLATCLAFMRSAREGRVIALEEVETEAG